MSMELIVGEALNSESLAEKIQRLEDEIDELKSDLENMTQEKDIQYDRAEELQEKFDEFFEYDNDDDFEAYKGCGATLENLIEVYQKMEKGELVDADEDSFRAKEIAGELKSCYVRLNLGVLSEIEEIIKLTDGLMELSE